MIDLTAKIDNDEAKKKFEELRRTAKQTTSSIVTDAERMDKAMRFRPQIDKKAAKEAEKTMQAIAEAMPLNIGTAFQKTERQIKSFVAKLQKEVQQAQIYSWMSDAPSSNPLPGIEETLTHLPEKANAAAGGFNALNFATQQLVREVPAATMGLHMFFLAISNNLPFFADAIKQVREENKALAASGKPTVGVFKQIIGSLFSWQTALIAGITALTLYGKEIGNWVKGLFKGKEALDAVARAEKALADVRRQGMLDAQEEVTQVKLAVKAMQDSNRSLDERKRAMRTLQDQYPEYFGKLREEQMLYGEVGDSVDVLIQKMVALATARKSFDQLVENEQKLTLLKDTKGYQDMMSAADTFTQMGGYRYVMTNSQGQRVKIKEQRKHYNHPETEEYQALLDAQEAFLDNLEEGGKEAEALFEEISDKYDGNVGAYIKAIEESNKKLTDEASALITTPDLSEDKAAAEEQKRKAEAVLAEAQRQAEERKRAIQRLNNDLSKEVQRTQREMDDAEIAAIKDGIERKRREIQAGYERRAAEIDKYEADIKAAQGGELTPEQKGHISYLRQANTDTLMAGKVLIKAMQDEAAQEATDAMNEYLASYGTFQEKLVAITAKYSRLIADAQTEGERMTLEAERDAILAEYEVQASTWAQELVDKTTEQLNAMIEELQAQVDAKQAAFDALDNSGSDDAKKYREEINRLNAQIKVLQQQLGKAKKDIGDDNWADATQVFQNISQAANDLADSLGDSDSVAKEMIKTIAELAGSAMSLTTSMAALEKAVTDLERASIVLTIISTIFKVVKGITDGIKEAYEETQEAANNVAIALFKYTEAVKRLAAVETPKIFGEDSYGEFRRNLDLLRELRTELEKDKEALSTNIPNMLSSFSSISQLDAIDKIEKMGADYALIADMRSKWQKFWGSGKKNIVVADLEDFYENGELNTDKLKTWYDTYADYLSESQKLLIEELIADQERYEEVTGAVTNYLKDIFGDYGATITDVLVDSFKEGTDAVEAFGDAASNVIERLTKDFIYSTFIKDFVDQAEADIAKLNNNDELSSEERVTGLIDILKDLESNVQGQQDEINAALAELEAAGYGYEDSASGQSTTSKGFQAMSQDTGDELNGRFTDIQGKVTGIHEAVQFMKSLSSQQLSQTSSINATVAMIHNDTQLIEKHTRALANISEDINAMRQIMANGGY